jgi:hypothetical protein
VEESGPISSSSVGLPIASVVSIEIRLWQLVTAAVLVALAAGVLIGHSFGGGGSARSNSSNPTESTDSAYKQQLQRVHRQELQSAAQANVRAAVPALEAYNADHGGYTGVTLRKLQTQYDAGVRNIAIATANASTYCIENTAPAQFTYHRSGPAGDILPGPCS